MKRVSESQLTKDDAELIEENDRPDRESKGFDRAPPEVMATRRIVKVRRTLSSTPPAPKAPNPFAKQATDVDASHTGESVGAPSTPEPPVKPVNPFAVLSASTDKLPPAKKSKTSSDVPTSDEKPDSNTLDRTKPLDDAQSAAKGVTDSAIAVSAEKHTETVISEKTEDGNTVVVSETKSEEKVKIAENGNSDADLGTDNDALNGGEAPKQGSSPSNGDTVNQNVNENITTEKKDSNGLGTNDEMNQSKSDQQASVLEKESKIEVKSSSVENVEEQVKVSQDDKVDAAKGEEGDAGIKKSGFGVFSGGVTFGTLNKSTPLLSFASAATKEDGKLSFATAAGFTNPDPEKAKEVTTEQKEFKEEKVETGEEGEIELFRTRAKLYCLEQAEAGAQWKERGVGQLKLKENSDKGRARLIMRTEATLRVILNCAIYHNTKLEKASDRSVRFSGIETNDENLEKGRCFLARFSTKEVTGTFITAVEKCKGDLAAKTNNE